MNKKLIIALTCSFFLSGCAFLAREKTDNDFRTQYREYERYVGIARSAIKKQEYIKAIDQLNMAIERSPFDATNYFYRGIAWYKKGNTERATEDFNRAILLEPKSGPSYVYRGICKMEGGDYEGVLNDYKKAIQLNQNDAIAHNNLALLYISAEDEKYQDKGKALEHAKKGVELTKETNAETLDTLAQAYCANNRVSDAAEAIKKAIQLNPGNSKFENQLENYESLLTTNTNK